MQQIKCESCETTKFFNHVFNGIPVITCVECGAQFTLPSEQVQVNEPVQKQVRKPNPEPVESKPSFEEIPEAQQTQSKEEFEQATGDKVSEQAPKEKPVATKIPVGMTQEEKLEYIQKLKQVGE